MIRPLDPGDRILEAPALYNAYPIANELSYPGSTPQPSSILKQSETLYLDDQYGRVYSEGLVKYSSVYGKSARLNYYSRIEGLNIIDELRVPFRKVPIYSIDRVSDITKHIKSLATQNSSYKILVRGQSKTYLLQRPIGEVEMLYGEMVNEPSFLPSHLRSNFDEYLLKSLWHSLSSILLHDACIDRAPVKDLLLEELILDAHKVRHTFLFDFFSLGIAQHYGLPSVGLDLTSDLTVASWFALNRVTIDSHGHAASSPVKETDVPTIFVFRCPPDAVYDYEFVRPKILSTGRPDNQHAWFGHVGWGEAKNQLGSYLICGFRLRPENFEDLPKNYWKHLFPDAKHDYILNFFSKMKNRSCYVGEAKRALDRLYLFQH